MAVVTDLVAGSGVGGAQEAAGANYRLILRTGNKGEFIAEYVKDKQGLDNTGMPSSTAGFGESTVDSATAQAKALASLNAARRHRFAGAPGKVSGATVSDFAHGGTPTVDKH